MTTHHYLLPLPTILLALLVFNAHSSSHDNFTAFEFAAINSSTALQYSSTKPSPSPWRELILQGDARASNTLQLTSTDAKGNPKKNSVGRALYPTPIRLWRYLQCQKQVASFETSFKFVLSSPSREIIGDGLTFFFAPVFSTIPKDSDGGFFGLFSNNTLSPNADVVDSPYHILAVEFDTYVDNRWDPNYRHIGIDVNTIRSRAEIPWDRKSGKEVTASVSYNTNNKKLYVKASYSEDDFYRFSSSIDLDVVLPEYVRVGFSASTGDSAVETHNVLYWKFESWLHNVTALAATDEGSVHHAPLCSA